MGYMQEFDHWFDGQLEQWLDAKISRDALKRSIREKILESYKNGLKAKEQSPAESTRKPNRFPRRQQAQAV